MKEILKNLVYGGYDLVTGGRGVNRIVGGENIRFPIRYSRYYPRNYEPELFKFLNNHCRTGSTFLDCGTTFSGFLASRPRDASAVKGASSGLNRRRRSGRSTSK